MVYQIREGHCHPPLSLLTHEPDYVAKPVGLISKYSANHQCDDGLNRDLDNLICMEKVLHS